MASPILPSPGSQFSPSIQTLKANRTWFLVLGILMVVAGAVAASLSFYTTFFTILTIGMFLMIAAGGEIASAIWTRGWDGTITHILAGLLYGILGFMMLTKPGLAASVFTLLLASMLLVGGLFRVIFAISTHFHGWFWTLISGGINLLLGLMIWQEWPEASLWAIGLFVGIDLIFTGWTWVALSLGLASLPDEPKTV